MINTQKTQLIIFDWDDTFTLGSTKGYISCYHETLARLDILLDPEEEKKRMHSTSGMPFRTVVEEFLKEKPSLVDQACDILDEHLHGSTFVDCLSLVPGSAELLERLHKKYTLTLATGAHPVILRDRIFPKFAIPNVFSQIMTVVEVNDPKKSKPYPYMAEQILEKQGATPDQAVLVGDGKNDVLMAQAADITPIVVLTGNLTREEAEKLGVKYIIPDVTYLEKILEEIESTI